ncbi:MAG: aminoacyl-tRNA hydrolase [Chloroflexi bacterium]|nr:aminoacyl-tRNA hydrolase [Chloroflexota bacterium]MBM3154370.1 aminoacyl-tRNA hydrolase [Chloroflexota bacterium]MBM3174587.1 aminoacyl-tRNA hydrolase [Chloroflexota bacterium]MBM4449347.1 aminoacyl-tRNA hydrolase [Chloroflexota bacterium]
MPLEVASGKSGGLVKLIVGLGNPGKEYAFNRHNVGFRCVNHLARRHSIIMSIYRCQSQVGTGKIMGVECVLAKPRTFVNRSGLAVSQLMFRHKAEVGDLIVIYDDLDLPLGKMRIRESGSSGGHKGMNSIIAAIGSEDFCRIKVGIGRPTTENGTPLTDEDAIINHVLSDFTTYEEQVIRPVVHQAAEAIESILTEGVITAMNKFN